MNGRRDFIKTIGGKAVAGGIGMRINDATAQTKAVPYSAGTDPARTAAPPTACDCHIHVFDKRFPMAAGDARVVPDASVADYRLLQSRLGTSRVVVVQPSTYGVDNSCLVAALAEFGATARGVAVVNTSVTDSELRRLAAAGVRGIRFNIARAGATTVDMIEPLAKRVGDLGWHVQIHMKADEIAQVEGLLKRLPTPIVFDHLGRIPQPAGATHPAFKVIADLMQKGNGWVKFSGAYMDTKTGAPDYGDIGAVAQRFVDGAPERVVWGSDWPHPSAEVKPDDAVLFDLLGRWVPDADRRRAILVTNSARLYGFVS
jgi:predicted TIM-barrel fold metal-dependent hydrolase